MSANRFFSRFHSRLSSFSSVPSSPMSIRVQSEVFLCWICFSGTFPRSIRSGFTIWSLQIPFWHCALVRICHFNFHLTMFCVSYGFPSYFHHVTAFRWSRPPYLALDSLLSPSRTLWHVLRSIFHCHVVFSHYSHILCRDTSALEVFLHYWQWPWLCSLGFAHTIKSLSWYPNIHLSFVQRSPAHV